MKKKYRSFLLRVLTVSPHINNTYTVQSNYWINCFQLYGKEHFLESSREVVMKFINGILVVSLRKAFLHLYCWFVYFHFIYCYYICGCLVVRLFYFYNSRSFFFVIWASGIVMLLYWSSVRATFNTYSIEQRACRLALILFSVYFIVYGIWCTRLSSVSKVSNEKTAPQRGSK